MRRAFPRPVALAARVLGGEDSAERAGRHAGIAHAIAGLLGFPIHAARGQLFVPLEVLARHGTGRQVS